MIIRKFAVIIALLFTFVALLPLSACGKNASADLNSNENNVTSQSYEEWLSSIKGADGVTPTIEISGGYWVINGKRTGYKAIGESGKDGFSAYEIYKKYYPNYSGTEKEWVDALVRGELAASPSSSDYDHNSGNSQEPRQDEELVVWTFTDELEKMIKDYYSKKYPDVKVKVEIIEVAALVQKLDSALRAKKNLPDVVTIEEKYLYKYAKSGAFLQIDDLLPADNQMYDYTLDAAKDYEGKIMAYAWQATPGVFYYRADMAKEILGVSSPEEMQAKVSTWAGVIDVATQLKHAITEHFSDIRIFSDAQAPARVFFSNRQASWIVDDKLSIEEQLYNGEYSLYEIIKTLQVGDGEWGGMNDSYINETLERTSGWYGDMGGDKVFSYLMPSYSLQYDLKRYSRDGIWAICEGPANYSDGGTWLGVIKSSNKVEQAKEMIKYFTMDKEFLRAWAEATGDFINDKAMMAEFAADASRTGSFLAGGQNQYGIFDKVARNLKGNNRSAYDSTINYWFSESAVNYAKLDNGITSKADALDAFVEQIRGAFGAVIDTEDIEFDF